MDLSANRCLKPSLHSLSYITNSETYRDIDDAPGSPFHEPDQDVKRSVAPTSPRLPSPPMSSSAAIILAADASDRRIGSNVVVSNRSTSSTPEFASVFLTCCDRAFGEARLRFCCAFRSTGGRPIRLRGLNMHVWPLARQLAHALLDWEWQRILRR